MEFIELDASSAFNEAIESLSESKKTVVCGSLEDKDYIEESIESSLQPVDEIIENSQKIDIQAWFDSRRKELEEDLVADLNESLGTWPGESDSKQGFSLANDMLTGQLHTGLVGVSIDADMSWKIPAHFKYGSWNDCPAPELHCAIWRYWQEKYGAQIVGVSNDVIEAYITNPPQTKEAAMELAWEQYLYCTDIVDQGVETVSKLGASIINHNVWFFWWD